ncbi:MAG TPA: alpha/beta hydrolase [Solirubrobacteraceae bacterium]|nr:alpha/beta hydrolase [Solirubrobacteraceae bacterium]
MTELPETVELSGGRRATYEIVGKGEPALYFQGGPGFSASLLRDDAELLADRFAVYLIDAPGSGGSSPPDDPGDYDHLGHARFYDEVRRALGIEAATILGISFGGLVALTYAALFPEATTRCVAIATRVIGDELAGDDAAAEMDRGLARHADAAWYPAALEIWEVWTERVLAATDGREVDVMMAAVLPLYTAYPERPGVARTIEAWRREATTNLDAVKVWESGLWQRIDARPLLRDVRAPTLVLAGELDPICGPTHARALAAELPHATVVIVPDCGHFIGVEAPVEFQQAIVTFAS